MNYVFEYLSVENAEDYARVNALAWKQSYKGIIDNNFLELINTEEEIQKSIVRLKNGLGNDYNKAFLLKSDGVPVGVLRVRRSKYEKYSDCGELGAIYLLDIAKSKGLGRVLFEKAVNELKKMGYNKMINGCLQGNPSNEFYKHMGGKLIETNPFKVPNGQELIENLYYYNKI